MLTPGGTPPDPLTPRLPLKHHVDPLLCVPLHVPPGRRSQESIAALRRPDPGQKEREAVARDLRTTREEVNQQTRQLKARLGHARLLDRKRLTALSVQSSAAAKQLQGIITKVSVSRDPWRPPPHPL